MSTLSSSISSASQASAIIVPGRPCPLTVSYGQLDADLSAFQTKLAKLGVAPQDAVSIGLPNSYEFVIAFLAAAQQRAITAPLNPGYKRDEFEFYINDLNSTLVLVPKDSFDQGRPLIHAARRYHAAIAECYWDGHEVVLDVKNPGRLNGKDSESVRRAEPEDVALVLHTSGTTGRPKAVGIKFLSLHIDVLRRT